MSQSLYSSVLVLVMVLNFYCLGTGRIRALVQAVSFQGVLLGITPLLVHEHVETMAIVLSLTTVILKGLFIPATLLRALRQLPIKREIEPLIGYVASLVLAAIGTVIAIIYGQRVPLMMGPEQAGVAVTSLDLAGAHLTVAASLATVFCGFLLLITRLKAITQVVGYLVLENGVFIFGMLLIEALPFFVEVGILLDLVVGIFVMVILINHITREAPSGGAERLSTLRED